MIDLIIKYFFFSRVDNYNLRQKPHIFYFFLFFCKKIIRVVSILFTIAIEDLEMHLGNLNLPLNKNVI